MAVVALAGGNEFRDNCRAMDRAILAEIGKASPRVVILPTAAASQNPGLAARNGIKYFHTLGAQASSAMILNRQDADNPELFEELRTADLIYLTGGDPQHLLGSLRGSLAWVVMRDLWATGPVIAGSSAGAMVLGERMYYRNKWTDALGLIPRVTVLPHYKVALAKKPQHWQSGLGEGLVFGIPEATGVLSSDGNTWQVVGEGVVAIYSNQSMRLLNTGDRFEIS